MQRLRNFLPNFKKYFHTKKISFGTLVLFVFTLFFFIYPNESFATSSLAENIIQQEDDNSYLEEIPERYLKGKAICCDYEGLLRPNNLAHLTITDRIDLVTGQGYKIKQTEDASENSSSDITLK